MSPLTAKHRRTVVSLLSTFLLSCAGQHFLLSSKCKICDCDCDCDCSTPSSVQLFIDCFNRFRCSDQTIAIETSKLLSQHRFLKLKQLNITNCRLVEFPTTICSFSQLNLLNLDHNRLTQLPANCLQNLSQLQTFIAGNNSLTDLPDGIFSGLPRLEVVELGNNTIATLHSLAFSNLTSIKSINLRNNRLTSLGIWPMVLADNGVKPRDDYMQFDFQFNNISSFVPVPRSGFLGVI